MKTITSLILIFTLNALIGQASLSTIQKNNFKHVSTPKMNIPLEDSNLILLEMSFNGVIPKSKIENLKIEKIQSISLVYSRYKLSEKFDQLTLNAQRMDKLYSAIPSIRNIKTINWFWIEQTGCEDAISCTDYFHGFVITLKSETDEINKLKNQMLLEYYSKVFEGETTSSSKSIDSLIILKKLSLIRRCDTITTRIINKKNRLAIIKGWENIENSKLAKYLKLELNDVNYLTLNLIVSNKGDLKFKDQEHIKSKKIIKYLTESLRISAAKYKGKKVESELKISIDNSKKDMTLMVLQEPILPDNIEFNLSKFLYSEKKDVNCTYIDTSLKEIDYSKSAIYGNFEAIPADIIFKVFDRNKNWKNCLVATDVTGSMSPYLAQFSLWHKLHLAANKGNHDFVFFNDGDNAPNHVKSIGKVGGVHYIKTSDYEILQNKMSYAMGKGSGGDCPENNIEAVIEGLKLNPQCKEVIMIADNLATPRDLALLNAIKVPIRLVLCGAYYGGINTAYLDMIMKNGGSIHTVESDIYDLFKALDGETITIDGKSYNLKGGKFSFSKI